MTLVRDQARRLGGHAALVIAVALMAGAVWNYPRYPDLPTRDSARAPDHLYTPGGQECSPARLRLLTGKSHGESQRLACAAAAQEEQRNQETASEGRYLSDLTKQTVLVARYQGWVFWWQALAASAAFIAAGVAAWCAYRAFRAAEDTLVHSQEVAEAELRPYVFLAEVNWHYLHTPDNPDEIMSWRVPISWKNSGQTPAGRVFIGGSHEILGLQGLPEHFNFADQDPPCPGGAIGPDQKVFYRREILVADFKAAHQKQKRLFFWAWIEYNSADIRNRHRTECCFEIRIPNDPLEKDSWRFMQASIIDRFNGFDQTCLHQSKT